LILEIPPGGFEIIQELSCGAIRTFYQKAE